MHKATARQVFLNPGLNFFLDTTDNCFVIPRGEAYEFFTQEKVRGPFSNVTGRIAN